MSIFDDLKKKVSKKGYMSLDGDERKTYSAGLKEKEVDSSDNIMKVKAVGDVEAPKAVVLDPPTQPDGEDRIARLERMVENLSNENTSLRKETSKMQEGWAEYKPPTATNKTATVKVYREDADSPAGLITKLTTFKNNAFNEETRKHDKLIYSLTVRFDDGELKDIKMDATEFAEMKEIEEVEIVQEDRRVLKKVESYAIIPNKDKEDYPIRRLDGGSGYGRNIGSKKTPLEVFRVKSTVTVKRRNGQEFSMEADFLNL